MDNNKTGFWASVIKDNQQLDSSMCILFVFGFTLLSLIVALTGYLINGEIHTSLYELIEELLKLDLMILTYYFMKSQSSGTPK